MSTNQYRGKEETDKKDFKHMTIEEQKKYSREHMTEGQDEEDINEALGDKAYKKYDEDRAGRNH